MFYEMFVNEPFSWVVVGYMLLVCVLAIASCFLIFYILKSMAKAVAAIHRLKVLLLFLALIFTSTLTFQITRTVKNNYYMTYIQKKYDDGHKILSKLSFNSDPIENELMKNALINNMRSNLECDDNALYNVNVEEKEYIISIKENNEEDIFNMCEKVKDYINLYNEESCTTLESKFCSLNNWILQSDPKKLNYNYFEISDLSTIEQQKDKDILNGLTQINVDMKDLSNETEKVVTPETEKLIQQDMENELQNMLEVKKDQMENDQLSNYDVNKGTDGSFETGDVPESDNDKQ